LHDDPIESLGVKVRQVEQKAKRLSPAPANNQCRMESLSDLLKELESAREAPTPEACQAFVMALWRRSHAQIADLSVQFADAGMTNIAAMCRAVAVARERKSRQ
jgi:hypothetical protein